MSDPTKVLDELERLAREAQPGRGGFFSGPVDFLKSTLRTLPEACILLSMKTTTQTKTYRNSNWLVILQDGFVVPANTEAEARAIAARFTARGIGAEARIAV